MCPMKEPRSGVNVSFQYRDGDAILESARNWSPSSSSSPSLGVDSKAISDEDFRAFGAMIERLCHEKPPPYRVLRTMSVWKDGFIIENGPFRSLDDPLNARVLQDIMNSRCPGELMPDAEDKSIRNVDINVRTYARNCPEATKKHAASPLSLQEAIDAAINPVSSA